MSSYRCSADLQQVGEIPSETRPPHPHETWLGTPSQGSVAGLAVSVGMYRGDFDNKFRMCKV